MLRLTHLFLFHQFLFLLSQLGNLSIFKPKIKNEFWNWFLLFHTCNYIVTSQILTFHIFQTASMSSWYHLWKIADTLVSRRFLRLLFIIYQELIISLLYLFLNFELFHDFFYWRMNWWFWLTFSTGWVLYYWNSVYWKTPLSCCYHIFTNDKFPSLSKLIFNYLFLKLRCFTVQLPLKSHRGICLLHCRFELNLQLFPFSLISLFDSLFSFIISHLKLNHSTSLKN